MPSLRHTVYIACRPEELWAALIEGEQTRNWYMGARVESGFELGAAIVYLSSSSPEQPEDSDEELRVEAIRGEIRELEAEVALAHSFRFCDLDEGESQVSWRLSAPDGALGVMKVDLDHVFPESGCAASLARAGECWPMVLSGLKTWLETSAALGLDGLTG